MHDHPGLTRGAWAGHFGEVRVLRSGSVSTVLRQGDELYRHWARSGPVTRSQRSNPLTVDVRNGSHLDTSRWLYGRLLLQPSARKLIDRERPFSDTGAPRLRMLAWVESEHVSWTFQQPDGEIG